ncbi:enhancer of mRNA-decapping protein 4-like isoform X2 [Hevea brasiliensis]|uniref:enhancer of mRNA-decapping protein 4-like isoform X2 n=1 Tax=Hevea brasiliensis TaxID=3981 RepID=UPI0025F611D0|nr:enhancer of mRNA-decapping protein 4-like isoform X2 [Hevea brasiliensis]XP_058003555.1 enhancer of mRNA-decapping protein 4-like isoform X2 [Hevea brasiliensis]
MRGGVFDVNKLFKPSSSPMNMMQPSNPPQQQQPQAPLSPSNSNPAIGNLTTSPSFPLPSSLPPSSPPYLTPSSSYPPPTGPYHPYHPHYLSPYPPPPLPQLQQHHNQFLANMQQQNRPQPISSFPPPAALAVAAPSTAPSPPPFSPNNPNPSGVLMDILTNQNLQQQQPPLSTNLTMPFSSPSSSSAVSNFSAPIPSAPPVSLASPTHQLQQPSPTPVRMLSSKLPKGRHLIGNHVVYDIDVRLQGEVQPQLEVTPITKYVSDPGLILGRQIAVNRNYICYGLKPGAIRILNINTALRSLLRGHNQKVTDMVFFAEDVHLLASTCIDGRVFIRKINEGPDEEEKPQIFERIVLALQIITEGESVHPRVCWHPHKQEILMVAIGNRILKIDTIKVGKGEGFSAEKPLNCSIDKLIDGVQLAGKHEGEVTELSMCQWMTTRLASASSDGTVKIWEDRKAVPLAMLRPHDGNPVNSVTFLTSPHRPDHIVLITGGRLNQEVKVWASAMEEGWLLPSDAESWQCSQTLTLKSSAESSVEDAFFNQVVALPRAGLFLLANAKKNAIYAIHIEYGPYPAATRMDYIAEFTVTMPILSLTGTSDSLPNGEHVVQVYCVQTQAIQQYALDLSQCLPPPLENVELEKTESNVSHVFDAASSDGSTITESSHGSKTVDVPIGKGTPIQPMVSSSSENAPAASHPESLTSAEVNTLPDSATSVVETKASALPSQNSIGNLNTVSPSLPLSPQLSRKLSGFQGPSNSIEPSMQPSDHVDQPGLDYLVEHRMDTAKENMYDIPSGDNLRKGEKNIAQTDISVVPESPVMFKHPTHLITPSEILSRAASSSENSQISQCMNVGESKVQDVVANNDMESMEVEVKVVGETGTNQSNDFDLPRESHATVPEKKEKSFYSQASDLSIQMARDCCVEAYNVGGIRQAGENGVTEVPDRPPNSGEDEEQEIRKDVPAKVDESETPVVVSQSPAPSTKGKKQKGKNSQLSGPSSPSPSPFNSTDSSNEPGCSSGAQSNDAALSQLSAMQDMLDQLLSMQKEMQKQMTTMISVPVSKEGKRLEASLGRSIEKVVKANTDALWARFQEENTKHEKLERDRMQQLTNLITNCVNKDLPGTLEKTLKKEISAVGPAVARAITPILEKSISSAITESFQKGVGEKAVNQLEKSVSSKLEGTVARQIQSQFQTSGKQALQDALRSSLEAAIIPAFEMSCKSMFDQIDSTFQKGFIDHLHAIQQQFDSAHSHLAIALRDAISSASSITQTLSGRLAEGQRNLLAIAAAGANSKVGNPSLSNGPLAGLHEMAEAHLDPTKELSRLIAECKFEEAFTAALHRSDVTIVSWLCSQVDLQEILSMVPLPLSQGVLLALLQQLACDISKETSRKLAWMTDVAVAINPADPLIALHVRPIFDQVYQILMHQRNLPTTSASESASIRLLIHVINSVLRSCK